MNMVFTTAVKKPLTREANNNSNTYNKMCPISRFFVQLRCFCEMKIRCLHVWFWLWCMAEVWWCFGWFAGDTVALFKVEGELNQHCYHNILQQHATLFLVCTQWLHHLLFFKKRTMIQVTCAGLSNQEGVWRNAAWNNLVFTITWMISYGMIWWE